MPLSSPPPLLDLMKPRRVLRLTTSDHPIIISNDDKNISNLEHQIQMEQLNVYDNAQDVCTVQKLEQELKRANTKLSSIEQEISRLHISLKAKEIELKREKDNNKTNEENMSDVLSIISSAMASYNLQKMSYELHPSTSQDELLILMTGMLAKHRRGPLYNDGAFLRVQEMLDTFADPFALKTLAILDHILVQPLLILN